MRVVSVFDHNVNDRPVIKAVKVGKRQAQLQGPQCEDRRVQLALRPAFFFFGIDVTAAFWL